MLYDVCLKLDVLLSLQSAGTNITMPYAEIGASLSTIAVLVYCCGGVIFVVVLFKFGCTQILWADDNWFSSIITLLQYPTN